MKPKATKLANVIRKAVLTNYGIAALSEIPRHEYSVALGIVRGWNNPLKVREIARNAGVTPQG